MMGRVCRVSLLGHKRSGRFEGLETQAMQAACSIATLGIVHRVIQLPERVQLPFARVRGVTSSGTSGVPSAPLANPRVCSPE